MKRPFWYLEKPWKLVDIHLWKPLTPRFGAPRRFLKPENVVGKNLNLISRFYRAWLVFTCKADCFYWEEDTD